jgi:hypothetical protein
MERSPALSELIAKITPEKLHKPIFEERAGSELWPFPPGPRLGGAEP